MPPPVTADAVPPPVTVISFVIGNGTYQLHLFLPTHKRQHCLTLCPSARTRQTASRIRSSFAFSPCCRYTHVHIHTRRIAYVHRSKLWNQVAASRFAHTYSLKHTRTHTHTHIHARTHTHTHTHTSASTHARTHARTHAHTHTHTHTYIHTYIHRHT